MNILILGAMDCSGAGHALMTAINQTTEHKARMVILRQKFYKYPVDLVNPGPKKILELAEWADVYNFQVRGEELLPPKSPVRPAIKTYHGSEYRRRWKMYNEQAKSFGWLQTCLTIELSAFGATWIGRAMSDLRSMVNPRDGFHIVHSGGSGKKKNKKGTDILLQALKKRMDGVTADIFEGVANAECLKRKARAHLCVGQVGPRGLGYGTSALESWAMGIPVIASAPERTEQMMRETIGYLPYCSCRDAATLRQWIIKFRDSPRVRRAWRRVGQRYLNAHHAPAVVAARYIELFEKA